MLRKLCSNHVFDNAFRCVQKCNFSTTPKEDPLSELRNNPYFEKYQPHLAKLQREDESAFKERVKSLEEHLNRGGNATKMDPVVEPRSETEKQPMAPFSQTTKKHLSDVMDLDKIKDKSAAEISQIWSEYHKSKDCIFAIIKSETYQTIYERSQECPTFLYVLPRENKGYEFAVGQFADHQCYFTSLIAYQAHKAEAPLCLSMTHYNELSEAKGIVLMKGEFDDNFMKTSEAHLLAQQIHLFYGAENYEMVKRFHFEPNDFKHMDIIYAFRKLVDQQ